MASQLKPEKKNLDAHLEGGWEQIKFHTGRANDGKFGDTAGYHRAGSDGRLTPVDMDYSRYQVLPSDEERLKYQFLREEINHPNILGPYDTKWGSSEFDAQMSHAKLGLPHLPGQSTKVKP